MRNNQIMVAVAFALTTGAAGSVSAASWQAGDWELGIGGNINAFYTVTQCDAGDLGAGGGTYSGLACAGAGGDDVHSISNGLLPASLNVSAKTNQNGYDIAANVNVYYGLASQNANGIAGDALDFSTVDARQVFLTFGNNDMGTVKVGRDFGLFGFDAIIGDMTLLGSGAAFVSNTPGHTTLGGLGFGYIYTDRLSQINWSSTPSNGLQFTVGVFNPLHGNESGASTGNGSAPGLHGKVSYDYKTAGGISGKVSASALSQEVGLSNGDSANIQGFDLFASMNVGNIGLTGYVYSASGVDTVGLGGLIFPGFDSASGDEEEASGFMVQATYKMGDTKLGLNLAGSEQTELTALENQKVTLGVYHNLSPSLTLLGEFSQQESELKGTGTDESSNLNLGAILFF